MGRAESARRERPSRRLSFRPRRPAGPAAPSPASFASRFGLPACLLALFTALAAGPVAAQTSITLVSNTGQADGGTGNGNLGDFDQAQAFTTGGNSAGYTLTGVDVKFRGVGSPNASYDVSIRADNSGSPGALVGDLTGPGTLVANRLNAFTTTGIDLAADTTYFLLLNSSSAATNRTVGAASDSEDSGGQSGWSIADGSLYRDRTTTGGWTASDVSKQIAVKGYAKGTLSADPVWSTTMTVGNSTGDARGYGSEIVNSTGTTGALGVNNFTLPGDSATHVVTALRVDTNFDQGAIFTLNQSMPTSIDNYILEIAGEELPLGSASFASARYRYWSTEWLAANAPALNAATFQTTLPLGEDVSVCLRTADQVCPGGGTVTLSSDASLSSLTVYDGTSDHTIDLANPPYAQTVANRVVTVTLTAMTTDRTGAAVTAVTRDGTAIADTVFSDGVITVSSLAVGANVIVVTVTAEDGTTTDHTVTVTRDAATSSSLLWSTTMTVAEATTDVFGYSSYSSQGTLVTTDFMVSGGHEYRVRYLAAGADGVELVIQPVLSASGDLSNSDDYILEWAGEELPLSEATNAGTQSWIFTNTWVESNAASLAEDNVETTLPIGGMVPVCLRTADQVCPDGGTALSSDASLSSLTVNDGTTDHTIDLAITPYAQPVANGVMTVTLTATTTQTGAAVTAVTLGGAMIDDDVFTDGITVPDLAVGANVIVVTVTAEDGTTTDHTVTVTQGAPPTGDLPWSTTMTVGASSNSTRGYELTFTPAGELDDYTFITGSGVEHTVERLLTANIARLKFDSPLSNRGDYILEWAGEELPLDEITSGTGRNQSWSSAWLVANAPSLSSANYATTLPVGGMVTVCLRLETQTCPDGTVTPNNPPVFPAPDPREFTVPENSPQGTNIGTAVTATDPDPGDTLTYSLAATPHAAHFQIDSATGQLQVKSVSAFNYESHGGTLLAVKVVADDQRGGTAEITVRVTIEDVDEAPGVPRNLTVTGFGTTSLQVTWKAPASNVGRPDIETYKVEYREAGTMDPWIDVPQTDLVLGPDLSTTISPVDPAKSYEVRVRTVNHEGHSPWVYSDVPVPVTIEAEHDVIGGGLEDLVFTLTRTGDTTEVLVATVTIAQDQTWLGSTDLSHAVTFAAGNADAPLEIAAWKLSFTPTTTGNLTATVSGAGILGGSDTVQVVSIADPPFTVGFDMSDYTFEEDATDEEVYLVATLDAAYPRAPSRDNSVSVSTQSGTARFRVDFEPLNLFLDLLGAEYQQVDDHYVARKLVPGFAIVDDAIYEDSEQFLLKVEIGTNTVTGSVRLQKPDGTAGGTYDVTITDDEDQPVLSLSVDPSSIAEEDDGGTPNDAENASIVTVAITNGKTFVGDQTVTLTFSGDATLGTHYSVSPADADTNTTGHQVVLPAETASVPVTVTATANDSADGNRTVTVTGDLDGTAIGTRNITILDDDTAITNSLATGAPGLTGTAQVGQELTATIGNIADTDVLPATFPDDYTFQWVRLDSSSMETPVGDNSGAYTVLPADVGGTIRVDVSFTDLAGNPEGPLSSAAVGPVVALLPELSFAQTRVDVDETAGSVELTVNLDRVSAGTVTVDYATSDGADSAVAGEDYTAKTGTLTFAPGQTSKTITIQITDDDIHEANMEFFSVDLSNPSGATESGTAGRTEVHITSEDSRPVASMDDVTVNEGAGTMRLTLRLSHPSFDSVTYFARSGDVGGTATASDDYSYVQNAGGIARVTVQAGRLSADFDIDIIDDGEVESSETITIEWMKSPGIQATPDVLNFTGTITDNDGTTVTAPAIVTDGVQVTSTPRATPDTYGLGETIEITVTFDSAVTVDTSGGTPRIQFRLGPPRTDRWAEYTRGSGGTALMFTYTVQSGDSDDDGIWLEENFLRLRSGTIRAAADNTVDATLTYAEPGLQTGHKVDGSVVAPTAEFGAVQVVEVDKDGIGRLEVWYRKGEQEGWGTVCDDRFDSKFFDYSAHAGTNVKPNDPGAPKAQNIAATLACRLSGTGSEGTMVPRPNTMPIAQSRIWLDDVRCSEATHGSVSALHHCYNAGVGLHNCTHEEDVHLLCTGTPPPVSATQEEAEPLTASFEGLPDTHDGATAFTFRLSLSDDIANADADMRDSAFAVTGGSVTDASRVDGRNDLWEIAVTPDGTGNIGIALLPGVCGTAGALCTADGRALTTALLVTVPARPQQPGALSAEFADMPAEHGGAPQSSLSGRAVAASPEFTFTVRFSEAFPISYLTMRDHVFTVTNGRVTRARRLDNPHNERDGMQPNREWEITVAPDTGAGDVTVTLPETTDCAATGAVCTEDGTMLSATVSVTVPHTDGGPTIDAGPAPLTAQFANVPAEHDGDSEFAVELRFSEPPAGPGWYGARNIAVKNAIDITGGTVVSAGSIARNGAHRRIVVQPSGIDAVTLSLPPGGPACDEAGALCTEAGGRLEAGALTRIKGPAGLSVADAEVEEGPGAALAFAVTLDRSTAAAVRVDYATRDGSAQAGSDYTARSGTLRFAPGEKAAHSTKVLI